MWKVFLLRLPYKNFRAFTQSCWGQRFIQAWHSLFPGQWAFCLPFHSRLGSSTSNYQPQPAVSLPFCAQPGGTAPGPGVGMTTGGRCSRRQRNTCPQHSPAPNTWILPPELGRSPLPTPHQWTHEHGCSCLHQVIWGSTWMWPEIPPFTGAAQSRKLRAGQGSGLFIDLDLNPPRAFQPRTASQRC